MRAAAPSSKPVGRGCAPHPSATAPLRPRIMRTRIMRTRIMRTRPPTCSPGRTAGFPSTRVSGSRSIDRDVPSYFQSLEHLLRYCARPPFALERLSVIRDADSRIARIRYVMPRHKAANWVGPGRKRKSTQPGASGVIELSPFEFLNRLADLIPQPRRHRHRYHGVFAPNHPLRPAVTALAERERREAARCHDGRACERRARHGRLW